MKNNKESCLSLFKINCLKQKFTPKKTYYFVDANKNLVLTLAFHQSVGFPYEIRLQRSPKFDIVAATLNSIYQPGHVFVTLFGARHFVHGYRAVNIVKRIIGWKEKKKIFCCWPCEGCKVSCRFFCFSPISSWTKWRHINTSWLPIAVSKWRRPKWNFRPLSRRISPGEQTL